MGFGASFYKIIFHYSQFYFITIAITLGSGTLGLPTSLADSGLQPFLITILPTYIAQVLTVFFFTEVLQKAYYRNVDKLQESNKDNVPIQLESHELPTYGLKDDLIAGDTKNTETIKQCLPNLHSLGELYLPRFLAYLCTITIFAELVIFMISHALAGGQSFAILTGASFYTVVAIFCWTSTVFVIIFDSLISPIVSILTLFKGLFFTAAIILTFVAGLQSQIQMKNDFSATGDSFLMSVASLTGFLNAMPLMFSRIKHTKNEVLGYNISIILGLTTCLILSILWCWSVLAVVPQHSVCLPNNNTQEIQMSLSLFGNPQAQCVLSPSLENSAANGEIATVPLSIVLQNEQNSSARHISLPIQLFVAITFSVSFIICGSVLYHTIKGIIESFWSAPSGSESTNATISKYITVQLIREWLLSLIVFTIMYAMISSNPKSFDVFVEQFGTLFTSIEGGLFFAIMIYKATYSSEYRSYVIPFQLPRWFLPFQYLIPIYYSCAFIYNIYITTIFFINN